MSPHRLIYLLGSLWLASSLLGIPHQQPQPPQSGDTQRVEVVAQTGGLITAMLPLSDGTVLVAEGSSVLRLNMNASPPTVLARSDLASGAIVAIEPAGDSIIVLTVSSLLSLRSAGQPLPAIYAVLPLGGQSVEVRSGLIAVAAREAGVHFVSTDTNGALTHLSTIPLPAPAIDITLDPAGSRAYVAGGEGGVFVVSIAQPGAPVIEEMVEGITDADSVEVTGPMLSVAGNGRISLLDLARSGNQMVSQYSPLHDGHSIVITGDYIYVADAEDGLKILWLAAFDRPLQIYSEKANPAVAVAVDQGLAFIAGTDGLRIVDIGNPYIPITRAELALPGMPRSVTVIDERVFVSLGDGGIAVVDASNRALPILLKVIPLGGSARAVAYNRGWLYVAMAENGIAMINAGRLGNELLDGQILLGCPAFDLAVRNDALYVACGEGGLLSLDITSPDSPQIVGNLSPEGSGSFETIHLDGKRAYITGSNAFLVADVSRPGRMGRLAVIEGPIPVDVGLGDVYLYALSADRIAIYDVRATAEPIYQRTYQAIQRVRQIRAADGRLFVTNMGDGPDLVILGVTPQGALYELEHRGEHGDTYSTSDHGGDVWLARGYRGVDRFNLSQGGAAIPVSHYGFTSTLLHLASNGSSIAAGGDGGLSVIRIAGPDLVMHQGIEALQESVHGLAFFGSTAAVALGEDGVALFEIGAAEPPVLIARRSAQGLARDVAIDSHYVYVADSGGLSLYDRRYLTPLARVDTASPALGIAVHDQIAFLPLEDGSLARIEVPGEMEDIRTISSLQVSRPTDLIESADKDMFYVLAGSSLLQLVVDQRKQLAILERAEIPDQAQHGFLFGDLLGVYSDEGAIELFDRRLFGPFFTPIGAIPVPYADQGVMDTALLNRQLVIAYGESGFEILNLLDLGEPAFRFEEPVFALASTNNALVSAGRSLIYWDISDTTSPRSMLAAIPLSSPARSIEALDGNRFLIGQRDAVVLARWDADQWIVEDYLPLTSPGTRIAVAGTRGYVALEQGGIYVIDLSGAQTLQGLFTFVSDRGQFASDLSVLDNGWLLVSWEGGIDLIEPNQLDTVPRLLDTLPVSNEPARRIVLSPEADRAAIMLAESGIAVVGLQPDATILGFIDTPGEALDAAILGSTLYVADGQCGLRVVDLADPRQPREVGYWRGIYVADVVALQDSVAVADTNRLLTLRYVSSLPPVLPPIPQRPVPQDGAASLPLEFSLGWEPTADPCNPLKYDVYLGTSSDPPFSGQISDNPELTIGPLAPLQTFYWRVTVTDRQGDRSEGPVWHFATAQADSGRMLPKSPWTWLERLLDKPGLALMGALIAVLGAALWIMRRRNRLASGNVQ